MPKKKAKELRFFTSPLPKTRKERDKFYRILEKTGTMHFIFSGKRVVVREER